MQIFDKFSQKKQLVIIAYKLLHDVLVFWAIFFAGLLIAEGLVPEYFSTYVSFTDMLIILALILLGIRLLGKRLGVSFGFRNSNDPLIGRKTIFVFAVFSVLIISNSLRDYNLSGAFIIGSVTAALIYAFWRASSEN